MRSRQRRGPVVIPVAVISVVVHIALAILLLTALWNPSALSGPRWFDTKDNTSEREAVAVAQQFLRLVAGEQYNLACTKVIVAGLVNPCMDDLKRRDLAVIRKAGRSLVVKAASISQTGATVTGLDTRPTIGGDFNLVLHVVGRQWLAESINGVKITGSS